MIALFYDIYIYDRRLQVDGQVPSHFGEILLISKGKSSKCDFLQVLLQLSWQHLQPPLLI